MIPSKRQETVYNEWQTTNNNILINAVAGSGKSSTLLEILKLCDARTLFLSFNKSIQEEIQSKIDTKGLRQGKAITLHSLGLSSLKTNYKYTVNNSKNYDLIKELQSCEKSYFKHLKWEDKLKITYVLMDMNDASRLFLTNDIDKINKYLLVMDKVIMKESDIKNMWEKLIIIRDKSYENKTMQIDFIDMLYVPIIKDLYIPINPTYLLLDECQDFSLLQHKLVKKLIEQGTVKKFIAVGDRNQAIYSFSGAFSSSFDYFLDYPNTIELPLDICYRCPTKIIDIANDIYDVMQYFTTDEGVVAEIEEVIHIKDNSMIICRNSKPLIDLYFQLISNGKSVYIKGDDILNNLIRFLKPYIKHNCFYAKTEMQYKLDNLLRDTTDSGKIQSYYFKETFEQFKMLMQYFAKNNEKVDVVINKLNDLFVDKKDAIMLCTIHKSKGLEADIVYILQENLIPSKFAKSAEQLIQENNLKYVARTRAKKELYFLNI
jgi:superfamily I DNA/RNA helicase